MFERATTTIDQREAEFVACERLIGRVRARQLELLRSLDADQVRLLDGSRSMTDWVTARLDVLPKTASGLVGAAKLLEAAPELAAELASGEASFDRTVATARLAAAGADAVTVERSRGFDLSGVARLTARHRRVARRDEAEAFRGRFFVIQPSLDESWSDLWGGLPGFEAELLAEALARRAEAFPEPGDTRRESRRARMADALVSIAQDSLDPPIDAEAMPARVPGRVSVFVDAALAGANGGEAGGEVAAGPRVGPSVLERLLCTVPVEVIGTDGLRAVWSSGGSRLIPPATRRMVLHRDGGCVIDGCSSRYRLEPHHVVPRSRGGPNDASNLASLCWYHHHVMIHGEGYTLDPASPPQRRRLQPPSREGPVPPG